MSTQVGTREVAVEPGSRSPGMRALRVAYASDFHAGPTTDPHVVSAACAAIDAAKPDLVLLGGDFVNFSAEEVHGILPELTGLAGRYRCFAVLGNHDWLADAGYIAQQLERSGITVLTNRNARLPPPFDSVWVCGLDDHWCGRPDAARAFEGAEGYRIVLMHAPSGILDIGEHRFDLALCGHTHGGQIALPGGRPILLPNGALSRRYHRGRYELPGGRTLVVSVGVGCALVPFRIHADPEIVVCTIGPADRPDAVKG
jgi:predicted MPP superfamily phosphohydrolase